MKRRDFLKKTTSAAVASLGAAETLAKIAPPLPTPPGGQPAAAGNTLSLPKGGGAVKGIGETFQPNPFTGTGNFSVPIYTSPGRSGITPQLALQYSTGAGNGLFGLGWSLSVPAISRKTEKGIPKYDDTQDIFVLSGAEDLVPYMIKQPGSDEWVQEYREEGLWKIYRYRPRTEGLHALIEFWKTGDLKLRDQHSFWRILTRDNLTHFYGCTSNAKLAAPENAGKVFEWRLELTCDAKGNGIWHEYKSDKGLAENTAKAVWEAHRYEKTSDTPPGQNARVFQTYLSAIHYGNLTSLADKSTAILKASLEQGFDYEDFFFKVQFDYGEYQEQWQDPATKIIHGKISERIDNSNGRDWTIRPDPFSSNRSGFEIRTYRRCERILMFHRVPEVSYPVLVRSTDFRYEQNAYNRISMLATVTQRGYRYVNDGKWHKSEEVYLGMAGVVSEHYYAIKSLPPLQLNYSSFQPEKQRFQPMTAEGGDMPERALSNPEFALVDLFGTGLPDVLYSSPAGYYYWKNKGEGRFSRRRSLKSVPAGIQLGAAGVGFGDMAGNGQADLLVHAGSQWGFFEADGAAGWQKFRPYRQQPSFDINDPDTRMFDLDGSGKTGALTTSEGSLYYYPCLGADGFGSPVMIRRIPDQKEYPDVSFSDPRVKLADMTGDGLNDIVLVHSGRIDYWPNLGHGKFGRRTTLARSPKFGQDFNPQRLFLVDIDGSGMADAIYVEADKVRFWFNQSGNAWSEEFVIHGTPPLTDYDAVVPSDMYGNGMNGLLWTTDWPGTGRSNYRFLDFTGGSKPNLLVETDNSMGSVTRIKYRPSTDFFLDDEYNSRRSNWISTLPFPVQCVEKVERIDRLSGTRLVTKYAYHHGYYDGVEREFRGFAFVEQWDSESFSNLDAETLHDEDLALRVRNSEKAYYEPPVLTKTWYHTGAYNLQDPKNFNSNKEIKLDLHELFRKDYYALDSGAFKTEPCDFEIQGRPDHRTMAEGWRSLRGSVLRQEVYGLDGSSLEEHPYLATEISHKIKLLQPKASNQHAVYQVYSAEKIDFYYERIASDPRVDQELTLETDLYGNPIKSCSIAYPRRSTNIPEQKKTNAVYTETLYINTEGEKTYRFIGVQCENAVYQLGGLGAVLGISASKKLTEKTLKAVLLPTTPIIPHSSGLNENNLSLRRLTKTRAYFRKDDQPMTIDIPAGQPENRNTQARLPLAQIGKIGLPYENYSLAFEETQLIALFGGSFSLEELRKILVKSGYVRLEDEAPDDILWWQPTGQQAFDPLRFYLAVKQADPWGNITATFYDTPVTGNKALSLLPEAIQDPLGNETRFKNDYVNVQPYFMRDINHNGTRVAYDALGLIVASAVMGKLDQNFNPVGTREGNYLENYTPLWEYDSRYCSYVDQPFQQNIDDVLQTGSTCTLYDLWRYLRLGQDAPPVLWSAARETHTGNTAQQKIMYFDGMGRELQTKMEAEPAPGQTGRRWVASGWKIYNNKGVAVRLYEPFYTSSLNFEDNRKEGCSATLFHDPVGRLICKIYPNHTYEKVIFTPWTRHFWDVNDTINLDPRNDADISGYVSSFLTGYRHCIDGREYQTWKSEYLASGDVRKIKAANNASAHADTPASNYLDISGRVYLKIDRLDTTQQGELHTHTEWDIQGNEISVTDPRQVELNINRIAAGESVKNNFFYTFDLLKRKLKVSSLDAGAILMLPDALGQTVWSKDAEGNCSMTLYDQLRRPTELWVQPKGQGLYYRMQKKQYGEDLGDPGIARTANLLGKVWQQWDGAGRVSNNEYDFKGLLLKSTRRLPSNKTAQPYWGALNNPLEGAVPPPDEGKLELKTYSAESEYDALNRITRSKLPDGTVKKPVYNKTNLLKSLTVEWRDTQNRSRIIIRDISYNAKGQREKIQYNNNNGDLSFSTTYSYEPETYRLLSMRTTRHNTAGGVNPVLQSLFYIYDPVGNISFIEDKAIDIIWCDNQRIAGANAYQYDALYRLVQATGREHIGNNQYPSTNRFKREHNIPLPPPCNNANALQWYTETYKYDKAGNLEQKKHFASTVGGVPVGSDAWTVIHTYAQDSNRSVRIIASNGTVPVEPQYDMNGNMVSLCQGMEWNYANQLIAVKIQAGCEDAGKFDVFYQYDAEGNRIRKYNKTNQTERIYLGDYEIFTESSGKRCDSVHIMDDKSRIAMLETEKKVNGVIQSTAVFRYQISNHLGSANLEVDDSPVAGIISFEEYLPYGGTAIYFEKNYGCSRKRYRYSGKERDEESGLYYYGARYYAPWMGRWCSVDPAGRVDGENLYGFVKGNPIKLKDFEGKASKKAGEPPSPVKIETNGQAAYTGENLERRLQETASRRPPPEGGGYDGIYGRDLVEFFAWYFATEKKLTADVEKAKEREKNAWAYYERKRMEQIELDHKLQDLNHLHLQAEIKTHETSSAVNIQEPTATVSYQSPVSGVGVASQGETKSVSTGEASGVGVQKNKIDDSLHPEIYELTFKSTEKIKPEVDEAKRLHDDAMRQHEHYKKKLDEFYKKYGGCDLKCREGLKKGGG
jgi:RHS repeat-associated protein